MNKKNKIILCVCALVLVICIVIIVLSKNGGKATELKKSKENINIVPTMSDEITQDSSWCATFQLVWNDMKNEVVKSDIKMSPQPEIVNNLNKEEFTESMLSDAYYYKAYGLKTISLKEQIENGIMSKFGQKSDIIDKVDWDEKSVDNPSNPNVRKYFFYAMLYREFNYLNALDKLDNDTFADKYKDVEYFGIDDDSSSSLGNQIYVMYYNSRDDFAFYINTEENDEVIICKSPKGKTFNEIYNNMMTNTQKYDGKRSFQKVDRLKVPNIKFNEMKEYTELEGKEFKTADPIYDTAVIDQALQTIQFELNEKGGKIKSEAAISMTAMATSIGPRVPDPEPRYFYADDTFALFLREKGKDMPYFAARIDDITKYQ